MRFGPIHTARPNRGSLLWFLALVMCYPGFVHFSLAELLFLLAMFRFWLAI